MNLVVMTTLCGRGGEVGCSVAEIDATLFALLHQLHMDKSEEAEEFLLEIDGQWEDEKGVFTFKKGGRWMPGFDHLMDGQHYWGDSIMKHQKKVLKDLATKGWHADIWEEGIFAIAQPDKKLEAQAAMGRLNSGLDGDEDPYDY